MVGSGAEGEFGAEHAKFWKFLRPRPLADITGEQRIEQRPRFVRG